MNNKRTGLFLQSLRKEKGLTQCQVAQELFVSPKTISKWERGEGLPDITLLSSLADFYSVTTDEILKGQMNSDHADRAFENQKEQIDEKKKQLSQLFIVFFYTSLSLLFAFIIISISIFMIKAVSNKNIDVFLAPEMMVLGIALASLIIAISDFFIAKLHKKDNNATIIAKKDIRKTWKRKKLLFSFISIICLTIALLEYLLRNLPFPSEYSSHVFGFIEDVILIVLVCLSLIFILLSFFEAEKDIHKVLKKRLFINLVVISICSMLFLTHLYFTEYIQNGNMQRIVKFENLSIVFLFNTDIKVFFYRGFSIVFLVLFIASLVISIIKAKYRWMVGISFISSIFFHMFCYFELWLIAPVTEDGTTYQVSIGNFYLSDFISLYFLLFIGFFVAYLVIENQDKKASLRR